MTYSKIHQEFAKKLNDLKALQKPQNYLGPNYLEVLVFWEHIERLTEEEMDRINVSYLTLDEEMQKSAEDSMEASKEFVGDEVVEVIWGLFYDVADYFVFGEATHELIADVENKIFYDFIMNQ